jgi:hypothetical protein
MLPDIIPVDTVAALTIAAGAAALAGVQPQGAGRAAIYHATSSTSHPIPLPLTFDVAAAFWSANPAPARLPLTRCERVRGRYVSAQHAWCGDAVRVCSALRSPRASSPPPPKKPHRYMRFKGEHVPTELGVQRGWRWAAVKLWVLGWALQLTGRTRERRMLTIAHKAFAIQNSLRYNKSMLTAVDNARALQAQLAPEEQAVRAVVPLAVVAASTRSTPARPPARAPARPPARPPA